MATIEHVKETEEVKRRYLRISKIVLLFTLPYCLLIVLLSAGIYYLKLGRNWALFSIDLWILSAILLLGVIIAFEIVFLLHYYTLQQKQKPRMRPQQPTIMHGKQVYCYTLPTGAQGGLFSKTFIMIDDTHVLNLRYQMIPPVELWAKQ